MGVEILQDSNPVSAEVVDGVIRIPALDNLVIGELPIKDIVFPRQCSMFRAENVRGILANDVYILVLRWDGSAMLTLREDKTLCVNFKYTSSSLPATHIVSAGAVEADSKRVAMRRLQLAGIPSQVLYSPYMAVSAVYNPADNIGIHNALSYEYSVSPVFVARKDGLHVVQDQTGEMCVKLNCSEYNHSAVFITV